MPPVIDVHADIETLPSPELLFQRRYSEFWSHYDEKNTEPESSEGLLPRSQSHGRSISKTRALFNKFALSLIIFLLTLNALQIFLMLYIHSLTLETCLSSPGNSPNSAKLLSLLQNSHHNSTVLIPYCTSDISELSIQHTQPRRLSRHSIFNSPNETEANEAWHGIQAGHGVVALTEKYSLEHHLPSTTTHTYDGDSEPKRIYFVEAYHAMHCVRMLRTLYYAQQHSLPLPPFSPANHDYHCFDRLRQYIMCNPDYTLVPNVAGHGKTDFLQPQKMCQDWDGLRDWTERWHGDFSDGFAVEGWEKVEQGGWYDDGNLFANYKMGDGLPVGEL